MDQTPSTGMPVQTESSNSKYWLIGAGIVIVALGAWYFMRSGNGNDASKLENSIAVTDQDANSISIIIDSTTINVPGFIVIHEDVNGIPGKTLANSKLLTAGTFANESIIMTTGPGRYYWAMLHGDDGNGLFDIERDTALKNKADEIVMKRFQVKLSGLLNGEPDIKG
jgi:hypothetical protein